MLAGFHTIMAAGDVLGGCLASGRLPLVFDLDETLLVAKSQSQLQRELAELRDVRSARCTGVHGRCLGGKM